MKKIFFILIVIVVFLSCTKKQHTQNFDLNTQQLIQNNVYVIHSLSLYNGEANMTSNIFVIKGINDTIWIYNGGYGDGGQGCDETCNDYTYYKGKGFTTAHSAIYDVRQVDSVITQLFHLNSDSVILQFIVPHFHADHINNEFIDAFYTTYHYPQKAAEKIFVHINDFKGATCNEPCCGTNPCGTDKENIYYASPYMPSWNPMYLNMFVAIGNTTNTCNEVIKKFNSESGIWVITKGMAVKDGGHTDGTINLQNENLKLRIAGTNNNPQCDLPEGWTTISVHGNTHFPK